MAITSAMEWLQRRLSLKTRFMALVAIVLIATGSLVAVLTWSSWTVRDARQSALLELQFATERGGGHIANALRALELVMQTTSVHVAATGSKEGLQLYLKHLTARLAPVRTVTVIDTDGVIQTDLRPGEPAKGYKVPDRAYFRAHFPPDAVNEYFYSPPIKSRLDGLTQITLSVASRRANGDLVAVVVSSIDDRYFAELSQELKAVGRYDARILYKDGRDVYTLHEPAEDDIEHGIFVDLLTHLFGGSQTFHRQLIAIPHTDLSLQLSLPVASYVAEAAPRVARGSLIIGLIILLLATVWWLTYRGRVQIMKSEQRFKDFAEATSDWFWEMDADLRFSYFSDHFPEITGVTQDTLLGKTREETGIPDVDPDVWAKHLADLKAHREFGDFVHPRTNRKGQTIWLSINGKPIFDDDGVFQGYRGTGTDITELEAAKETRERLSQAIETVPVGIALFDSDDRLVFFNSRYGELMEAMADILKPGVTFEEMIRTMVDRQPVKDARGRGEEFIQRRVEHHRNPTGYFDIRRENDWLLANETRLPDGSIFTIITDITERKQAEEALSKSENLLNSIIENIPVGLLIKGPDHIVERANNTYLSWYGFNEDAMEGRRSDEIENFQSPEEAEFMNNQELKVLTTGQTQNRQVERSFADGKIHTVSITKFPVYDQEGNITKVGSVSVDLTEQVQAEENLRFALVDAEQANQAKSEFLATMSHEFRTPLNAILGFADILYNQYMGPPGQGQYREYAGDIKVSGEHLLEMINEVLDLSAIEAGKKSLAKNKLSLLEVISDCERIIETMARSNGISLETKVPKDLPPLYADKRSMRQILLNLLTNAVKFTPEGGKITISAEASKRHITLKVIDTGKGIPAEKLPKLTDPFNRADTDPYLSEQGWGLGLSITKALIDLHEGNLDIKSKVGKGTTVTVTFPIDAP